MHHGGLGALRRGCSLGPAAGGAEAPPARRRQQHASSKEVLSHGYPCEQLGVRQHRGGQPAPQLSGLRCGPPASRADGTVAFYTFLCPGAPSVLLCSDAGPPAGRRKTTGRLARCLAGPIWPFCSLPLVPRRKVGSGIPPPSMSTSYNDKQGGRGQERAPKEHGRIRLLVVNISASAPEQVSAFLHYPFRRRQSS